MFKQASEYKSSEADLEFKADSTEQQVEAKDSRVEFKSHDKPAERAASHISHEKRTPYEESMYHISEAGYQSISDARAAVAALRKYKDNVMMSFAAKIKDRIFNQGEKVKRLIELEKQIKYLQRRIKVSAIVAQKDGISEDEVFKMDIESTTDNVIRVPESTWKRSGNNSEVPNEALVEAEAELAQLKKDKIQITSDVAKGIRDMGLLKSDARENNEKNSYENRKDLDSKIKKLQEQIDLLKAA